MIKKMVFILMATVAFSTNDAYCGKDKGHMKDFLSDDESSDDSSSGGSSRSKQQTSVSSSDDESSGKDKAPTSTPQTQQEKNAKSQAESHWIAPDSFQFKRNYRSMNDLSYLRNEATWWGCIDPLKGEDDEDCEDKLDQLRMGQPIPFVTSGELDRKIVPSQYKEPFLGFKPQFLYWTVNRAQACVLRDYKKTRGFSNRENLVDLAKEMAILLKYKDQWPPLVKGHKLTVKPEDIYMVFESYYKWAILHPKDEARAGGPFGGEIPFLNTALTGIPGQNLFARDMALFMDTIQEDAQGIEMLTRSDPDPQSRGSRHDFPIDKFGTRASVEKSFYYDPPKDTQGITEAFITYSNILVMPHRGYYVGTLDEYWALSKVRALFTQDVWWKFTTNMLGRPDDFDRADERTQKILELVPFVYKMFNDATVHERMVKCYLALYEHQIREGTFKKATDSLLAINSWIETVISNYANVTVLPCDVDPNSVDASEICKDNHKAWEPKDKRVIPNSLQDLFRITAQTQKDYLTRVDAEMKSPPNDLDEYDLRYYQRELSRYKERVESDLSTLLSFVAHYHIPLTAPQTAGTEPSKTSSEPIKDTVSQTPKGNDDDDNA